jgi:hypothetical protein
MVTIKYMHDGFGHVAFEHDVRDAASVITMVKCCENMTLIDAYADSDDEVERLHNMKPCGHPEVHR